MNVLLTGGSGDLATGLTAQLSNQGDSVRRLDIRPPHDKLGEHINGSILDRDVLATAMQGVDCVVHIAAWHGIHEVTGQKDVYDFWDLNVTGTFYVFEAAARANIKNIVYISSTSIDKPYGVYGHTKVLGEEIARTYSVRHNMNVITLRPRAFIPHWNTATYTNYIEWAKWFWRGAVHIDDVVQAVMRSIDLLNCQSLDEHLVLVVDGAYDYTDEDLANWDDTTFARYYPDYVDLVKQHGLDPTKKPRKLDSSQTQKWLGYEPQYSLKNLLEELAQCGESGPPNPYY